MKLILSFSVIILAVCLAGCNYNMQQGKNFDVSSVKNIRTGKTTKSEVTQVFGQPPNRNSMGGGKETWMYQYAKSQSHISATSMIPFVNMFTGSSYSGEYGVQMLSVQFTGDIVSDCTYNKISGNMGASGNMFGTQSNNPSQSNVRTPCNEAQ